MAAARLVDALGDRYLIERELGAGGMATVYLARDRKHDRQVAVKVLHPDLAAALGAERFLGEIKTTANLQHPHILALHDSGAADGLLYYVMPYVDGESLRARITREKQLPLDDAVRIAREVADALAYAHQHGVVHRDIKPENILLQSGHAMVADFGIALAVQHAGGSRLTQTGLSLGTPQYMAPEQAMGERSIDHRADIYALGAVTYEMLTGEPPFTGATLQAVVAKVLTERPVAPSSVRDTVPSNVESAVMKALAKLPADRFGRANDFVAAFDRADTTAAWTKPGRPGLRTLSPALTAGVALVMLAGGLIGGRLSRPRVAEIPPSHLIVAAPSLRSTGGGGGGSGVAITPDGSTLLYRTTLGGLTYVTVRPLHALDATTLRETVVFGRLSPAMEAAALGLIADTLAWVTITGGAPVRGPVVGSATFVAPHPDGSIWLTRAPYTTLERFMPSGGSGSMEVKLTDLPNLRLQQILDDGRTGIFSQGQAGPGLCVVMDLRTGERVSPLNGNVRSVLFTAGQLVYVTPAGTLYSVPFDVKRRRIVGLPVRLADSVAASGAGFSQLAVAGNGTLAYVPQDEVSLVFVDRAGTERRALEDRRAYHGPRFSPDGRRVAVDFTGTDGMRDVWLLDVAQRSLQRATFNRDVTVGGHDPTWTPDGRYVSYIVQRDSIWHVLRTRTSGGSAPESLFSRPHGIAFTGLWLKDMSAIIPVSGSSGDDIAIVRNGGRGTVEPLIATPNVTELAPAPSPDGRLLAYVSDKSGPERFEVYVRTLGGDSEEIKVSQNGGAEPVWNPARSGDGWELFYRGGDDEPKIISVQVTERPELRVGSHRLLFAMPDMVTGGNHANFDVSPDGQTFVMVRADPKARIVVIQNLPALVAKLRGQATESR